MFLKNSRYYKTTQVEKKTKIGQSVKAIKLRRLPNQKGTAAVIKKDDRLDIIAQRQYNQPTKFWHIADANTELQANDLISESGRTINVPEN
jgi:hypothetical protein